VKPMLYVVKESEGRPHAILIDEDKYFSGADDNGRTRHHFSRCVDMGPFSAGEIQIDKAGTVIFPRAAVVQLHKTMEIKPLSDRRLTEETAKVLLSLAASANNITIDDSKTGFRIKFPALEGVEHGWCQWKFLAAWCWNKWVADGDKPAAMHKDLASMGYKKNATAFRQMMKRMGFVTHTKTSESQHAENE
jgi:hypothetical protein